jgi:hypothetical protein
VRTGGRGVSEDQEGRERARTMWYPYWRAPATIQRTMAAKCSPSRAMSERCNWCCLVSSGERWGAAGRRDTAWMASRGGDEGVDGTAWRGERCGDEEETQSRRSDSRPSFRHALQAFLPPRPAPRSFSRSRVQHQVFQVTRGLQTTQQSRGALNLVRDRVGVESGGTSVSLELGDT